MPVSSTYAWSTLTTAQSLSFTQNDVLVFDTGATATQVVVSVGPVTTTETFGGKSFAFLNSQLTGAPGEFLFTDGSHLGIDGTASGFAFNGTTLADQYDAQNDTTRHQLGRSV